MKIKNDFVTNSSSASFILTLNPNDEMTLDEFRNKFLRYVEVISERESLHFWDGSDIAHIGDHFSITEWTSMYNGQEDIPSYMKFIMVDNLIGNLDYGWFEFINFEIEEDN